MLKWLRIVGQVFQDGGPSTCQFALTNICNAACDFCSFSRDKLPSTSGKAVDLNEAKRALDILSAQGVRFMVFTGGEPMVHRSIYEILAYSTSLGMTNMMVTNGFSLNERSVTRLAEAGLSGVIISIDSHQAEVHEENRGLKNVCSRIEKAIPILRKHKIGATASVTLSRLIEDTEKLPDFLSRLGFDAVTFSFPLTSLDSSYLGAADSDLVSFSRDEMHGLIRSVKALKKRFPVLNPTASLDDMHAHLDGKPERFECLGGSKQFYLDWNLMLWRCNSWSSPMCHVFEFNGTQRIRDGCQACMVDCFRDASVQQHVAMAISDARESLMKGQVSKAARHLFSRDVVLSLQSVLETSFWLHRV